MNCEICGKNPPCWSWTDAHGVAQCYDCGAPYRIWHYEGPKGEEKRVEKPPELLLKSSYVETFKAYWQTHKRRMPSGFSFLGGQELATREDAIALNDWLEANPTVTTPVINKEK